MSRRLEHQLIRHEGLKLKPYVCPAGKLTIGIGRNLEANGISEEEALFLLRNDLEWVKAGLDRNVPWWRSLDEVRQAVLQNMAFNLGIGGLLGFKKFLSALQNGVYTTAAAEMLDSRWADQVGPRAIELSEMVKFGEWRTADA